MISSAVNRILPVALVLLLAGCSAPATEPATVDTDVAVPFALDQDFADPDILLVGTTYYA